jgi:hypothetical protein
MMVASTIIDGRPGKSRSGNPFVHTDPEQANTGGQGSRPRRAAFTGPALLSPGSMVRRRPPSPGLVPSPNGPANDPDGQAPQGQLTLPSPLPVMAFGDVTFTENQ